MAKSRKKTSTLTDLEPVTLDKTETGVKEAESVRGGRKAGGTQQEYLVVKLDEVFITSSPATSG